MNVESIVKDIGKEVDEIKTFPAGEDFQAVRGAEKYLKDRGYITGSMQRNAPIGIMDKSVCCGISKWFNMTDDEHKTLDGVMLSDSFRHDDVFVVIFATVG